MFISQVNAEELNNTIISNNDSDIQVNNENPILTDDSSHNEVISAKIQLSQSGKYYDEKTVSARITDSKTNKGLANIPVTLKFSNKKSVTLNTDSNGKIKYKLPFKPGNYKLTVFIQSDKLKPDKKTLNNIKINKAPAKITVKKLSTSYKSNKNFKIKVTNTKNKKGISNVKLLLKIDSKGKIRKTYLTTNSKGIAKFNCAKLDVGSHKIEVKEISSKINAKSRKTTIKVGKATATFDELDPIYIKKATTFNIALFNKNTGKAIKGVKLKVKIFDGKKYHVYNVKTGKYGKDIDVSYLGLGHFKVKAIFDGNSRYKKCSATDYIDVVKSSGKVLF